MIDNKSALTLAHMATHPKERASTSRALVNLGERHELILKALQSGYSFREIAESLKQHEGIDVSTETVRRHYSPLVGKGSKKRRRSIAIDKSATVNKTAPRPTPEPQTKPPVTNTSTHAGIARLGRTP